MPSNGRHIVIWQALHMTFEVLSGPWSVDAIDAWLTQTVVPLRLATSGSNGPLVQSLWFDYHDGALWCATQSQSLLATRLRRDPRVGWEVSKDEPPYRGVRGQGKANLIDDSGVAHEVLERLVSKYGQAGTPLQTWLSSRIETELVVHISGLRLSSWDYSARM